jgi:hypothetical protein
VKNVLQQVSPAATCACSAAEIDLEASGKVARDLPRVIERPPVFPSPLMISAIE